MPLLLLGAAGLTGCMEYTIETTLHADGSGVRRESVEVDENEEVDISPTDFTMLTHIGEEYGWAHREETEDGETYHLFTRRTEVPDLSSWSRLDDQVRIAGTTPSKASTKVGYVTLGDVRFHNTLRVGRGTFSDGSSSHTYRETFAWEEAVDALAEFFLTELDGELAKRYPALSSRERGEVVGFARARFWMALDDGLLFSDGEEDRLLSELVNRTSREGIKIVRSRYPGAEAETLKILLRGVFEDGDDRLVAFLEEDLKGLNLAMNSEITFRLNMPGRVTGSNAHETDGTTLVWRFGPTDALETPVEIYAESRVER